MNVGNVSRFNTVTTLKVWVSHVLPLVYDDTLSYMELLGKVTYKLNELIENNNKLPDYIADLIREYISSGEIEKVLADVLANYMLNVKFPPAGLTPATGDGSADDTEAIQGCIDYAFNHGGMAIYFPSGSYLTRSLVLKNKCTMFGYDRYNTRLVLKGGATTAMFTGNVDELTLTGMGFDGNMDIQVNNVNLFDVTVGSAIITNVLLTDGYDLLKVVVNRDLQLDDVIFNHAVENGLVVSGNGYVQADNVIFKSVSALIGKNYVVLGCNDSILTKVKCEGASPNGVRITGNNNVVKMWNEGSTTAYVDEGQNNSVEVYTVSDVQKFSGNVEKHVSGTVTNTAGGNVSETVGGKKTVQTVKEYEEIVGAGKTVNVTGNFDEVVSGDKSETAMNINDTSVTGRTENTGTNKTVIVKGNDSEDVTGTKTEKVGSNKQETVGGTKVETITGKYTVNANGGKVVNTTQYDENMESKNITGVSITETLTGDKNVKSANSTENVSGDKTVNAGGIAETSDNRTIHTREDLTEQVDGSKSVNAKDLFLNILNPVKYKKPVAFNKYFNTIPFKDINDIQYDLLVKTDKTDEISGGMFVNVGSYLNDETSFTDALNQAINDVKAHGTVFIPNGNYEYIGTLTLNKPLTLMGAYTGFDISESTTNVTNDVYKEVSITFNANVGILINSIGVSICNLCVRNTFTSGNACIRISLDGTGSNTNVLRFINISNVTIWGNRQGYGIFSDSIIVSTFRFLQIHECTVGIYIKKTVSSTSLLFDNCWAINCINGGYLIQDCYYSTFVSCAADSVNDASYGYYLQDCKTISFVGCGCEKTTEHAYVLWHCSDIVMNVFFTESGMTDNKAGIKLDGCTNISLNGCTSNDDQTIKTPLFAVSSTFFVNSCNFTRVNIDNNVFVINGLHYEYLFNNYEDVNAFTVNNCSLTNVNLYYVNGIKHFIGEISATENNCTITLPNGILTDKKCSGVVTGGDGGLAVLNNNVITVFLNNLDLDKRYYIDLMF